MSPASYERFCEALLQTEVASRDSHGGESRLKAARFPAGKTLAEFDFSFQRSVRKQVIEHLGQLDFLHARENVVLLGPPGTGKSHLAIAISIRACLAGQRVAFATATEWAARLSDAKRQGKLEAELRRLGFIPLIVVDRAPPVGPRPHELVPREDRGVELAGVSAGLAAPSRIEPRHQRRSYARAASLSKLAVSSPPGLSHPAGIRGSSGARCWSSLAQSAR